MASNSKSIVSPLSFNNDAVLTTSYEDDYIFRGQAYGIESFVVISSGDTEYDIVFDTTNVDKTLVALPTTWATTAGDVTVNLGSCASYADGTAIVPTNRRYDGDASEVVFKYNVTPTDYVVGPTNLIVGSAATNQNSGGSSSRSELPIILETGIKYIFRIANNSGADIKFGFLIYWYEV